MKYRLTAILVLSLSLCASAQGSAGSILPKNPHAVIEIDGPALMGKRFGDTNIGALIKSPMIGEMLEQARAEILSSAGDDQESAEQMLDLLLGFDGRLRIGGGLFEVEGDDPDSGAGSMGGYVMLQWFKGESSDFGAWLEFMNEQIEAEGGEDQLQDLEVGDFEFQVLPSDGMLMVIPTMYGDSLVQIMVFGPEGEDLEERLVSLVTEGERYEASAASRKAPVFMSSNLKLLIELLADKAEQMAESDEYAAMAKTVFDVIGLETIQSMEMTFAPAGKHTLTEVSLKLAKGPSFLDIVRPEAKSRPELLRYIPRDSQNWSISPFRLGKIYELAGGLMTAFESAITLDQVEGMMAESTGVELKADLLDHIGDEVFTIQDVDEASDLDSPAAGICLGFPMKDAPAFDKSIETILRSRGLHVSRKVKKYRDHKVKSLSIIGPTIHWAVLDEALLIGVDNTGLSSLHKVIDSIIDVREGNDPADFSDAVKDRMKLVPQQWQGCGYTDVSAVLNSVAQLAEQDPSIGIPQGVLPMIEGLLKQFDLSLFLSTMSDEGTVLRSRLIW